LITLDNKTVIIPNGELSNASIINYTREDKLRLNLEFGVDYGADTELVRSTIMSVVNQHPQIVDKEKALVKISEHGDSAVIFLTLVWVLNADYHKVRLDLMESVKLAFDAANINIPYPHMDVNIINQ
jgi:small conductance mechanosensitive channel